MKKWLRFFRVPLIAVGGVFCVFMFFFIWNHMGRNHIRQNEECVTQERVFDYADLLTDEEEEKLEELIAKKEKECGLDIVIVNVNFSLESFARMVDEDARIDEYAMIFADEFYESGVFGYNEPYGDGVILVDNQFREADGYKYLWMGTTGKAETEFTERKIDDILIEVEDYVDYDSFQAYKKFINGVEKTINYHGPSWESYQFLLIISGIITLIFVASNRPKKKKQMATGRNFLNQMEMKVKEDTFIRKDVSHRVIDTYSSTGGGHSGGGRVSGGHHTSRSGRSHGGGGRRR